MKYQLRHVVSIPEVVPKKYHWRHVVSMPEVILIEYHLVAVVLVMVVVVYLSAADLWHVCLQPIWFVFVPGRAVAHVALP